MTSTEIEGAEAIQPGAEPFAARPEGEPVGAVLVVHGFTGSPISMRPWAEHLLGAGFEVSIPLLAGHGTSWQQMNDTTWHDWYDSAEPELLRLAEQHGRVGIAALSMGGSLALRLAELHPEKITGLALVNPSVGSAELQMKFVPLLSTFVPSVKAIGDDIAKPGISERAYDRTPLRAARSMMHLWKTVRGDLSRVDHPILLFRSEADHVVDPLSARIIREGISSERFTERMLQRSYHVATLDYEAPQIFAESTEFFTELALR
ncbi:MAG: alpha/beta fold hydrolase [Microbacterium sp.]